MSMINTNNIFYSAQSVSSKDDLQYERWCIGSLVHWKVKKRERSSIILQLFCTWVWEKAKAASYECVFVATGIWRARGNNWSFQSLGSETSSTGEMLQCFGRIQDRWWTVSLPGRELKVVSGKWLIPLGIKRNSKSLKTVEIHWPEMFLYYWKNKGSNGRG